MLMVECLFYFDGWHVILASIKPPFGFTCTRGLCLGFGYITLLEFEGHIYYEWNNMPLFWI